LLELRRRESLLADYFRPFAPPFLEFILNSFEFIIPGINKMSTNEFNTTTKEYCVNERMYSIVNKSEFSTWLFEEMERRHWSQADLARESGLSRGAVGNVLRQERDPGKDFLIAIAKAFHLPVDQVFRTAGIFPQSQDDEYSKEAAHLVSLLPEDVKKQAIDYIRFLVNAQEAKSK
jgi:transcriptional regulator with XRE-family HTH domain